MLIIDIKIRHLNICTFENRKAPYDLKAQDSSAVYALGWHPTNQRVSQLRPGHPI